MFICDISVFNKYGKQRLDERLAPIGIDWRALVVLLVIEQVPDIPQTRLSPFLQTDKANVTKLLQILEKRGLIRREADGEDQRNKICQLTPQGQALTPQLHEALSEWEDACFQGLSPDELTQFRKTSEIISRNLMNDWKAST